jgi:RecA-family ATPase
MSADLAQHMERVATALLGAPNEKLSRRSAKELRFGTHGSMKVDLAEGVYYDFEADEGGGVLDLIQRRKGLSGEAAFDFIRDLGCEIDAARPERKLIATYPYRTESGVLKFQVLRYDPKDFRQRRPDGNGGWIWDVSGIAPLLYRLPETLEALALGHLIFIPEGEGKADALAEWNIPATCNAGGSRKWQPEHAAYLAGADVVILPDNDPPGRGHANVVGTSLQNLAKTVRLLELPGLGPKGDVRNWIEAGGTAEELWKLVETHARPWEPYADETPSSAALPFICPTAWQDEPVPKQQWLAHKRIPMHAVCSLGGDGAVGKTTIALQLGVAVASGAQDWLGAVIETPGPVIFFTAEEDEHEVHRRLSAINKHTGIQFADLAQFHLLCTPDEDSTLGVAGRAGSVNATDLFARLETAACDIRPALIVIEAAADVFTGSENDRSQVVQFIGLLRRMAIKSGAAVVLLAHPSLTGLSSGSGTSGSTHWNNAVRSRLYLKSAAASEDEPDLGLRELRVMKANYGPVGEKVQLRWERGVYVPHAGPSLLERAAAEASVDDVYLRCLDVTTAQGRSVSPNKSSSYAPSVFEAMPEANKLKSRAFALAQERLFSANKIAVESVGPPSKKREIIVRASRPG